MKAEIQATTDIILYARKQVDEANARSENATAGLKGEVTALMEVIQHVNAKLEREREASTKKVDEIASLMEVINHVTAQLDNERKASAKRDEEMATMQELLMFARRQMDKDATEKQELTNRLSEVEAQLAELTTSRESQPREKSFLGLF